MSRALSAAGCAVPVAHLHLSMSLEAVGAQGGSVSVLFQTYHPWPQYRWPGRIRVAGSGRRGLPCRRGCGDLSGHVEGFFDVVPVLLVTGPIGVGKTAVLREADARLLDAGSRHGIVELEEIARCWPSAIQGSRTAFAYQNLAALWSNFVAVGALRLLLSALVEQRSDLRLISEAIPGAAIIVVRLHAPLSALERRIRLREPAAHDDEFVGARWWTQHFDEVRVEDYVVETENRPVGEIARGVLRLADWLP
jgi:hypothetical protein